MIHITRRETFNAAHRLWNQNWSAEKNAEVFGLCSGIHGHNWELFVTVKGEIDEEYGYFMDLKDLSQIIKNEVSFKVDHSYLNENPFLKGLIPSTENFAVCIWNVLEPIINNNYQATLHSVKLIETPNHYVEYFGE
jgi:6-pyruvoyltetrahydropterin/6-carboxytetrahydropterin synthase